MAHHDHDHTHDHDAGGLDPVIAVAINNTNTAVGIVRGLAVSRSATAPSSDPEAIARFAGALLDADPAIVMLASVNRAATRPIIDALARTTGLAIRQFGPDMPVPIAHTIPEPVTTGLDRFLVALGAFDTVRQACVVVDAGTALTCDFVDGEGVFHGGAILPGPQTMLDSLPWRAPALPPLKLAENAGDLGPFGQTTEEAMRLGVLAAARGAVRFLAERYAEHYEAYPQIIATGGAARALFEGDDLVETIVPDLQLIGIGAARLRLVGAPDES